MSRSTLSLRTRLAAASAAAALLSAGSAWALPTGGTVTAGTATITPLTTTVTVNQTSARAFIDWTTYGVAAGQSVIYNQPSSGSITFNRLPAGVQANISGAITANGGVWMFTPGGLAVNSGATINVGSFVATTATRPPGTEAAALTANTITNPGPAGSGAVITVSSGATIQASSGFVGLLAPNITQNGSIQASNAVAYSVVDGGGFTFAVAGGGLVLLAAPTTPSGGLQPSFTHGGSSRAGSFFQLVTPPTSSLSSGYQAVINLSGFVQASGVLPQTQGSLPPGMPTPSIVINAGGSQQQATVAARTTVDASAGSLSAAGSILIDTSDIRLGSVTGGGLIASGSRNVSTTQAINLQGPALLYSNAGSITVGGAINARDYARIYGGGNIALQAPVRVTAASSSAYNSFIEVSGGGDVTVADGIEIRSDGYLDISSGDVPDTFSLQSGVGPGNLSIGRGASLVGAYGVDLDAAAALNIAVDATVKSLEGSKAVLSSTWPYLRLPDNTDGASNGGVTLVGQTIDLQGQVYSYATGGTGRGPIFLLSRAPSTEQSSSSASGVSSASVQTAVIGGAGSSSGYNLSNAEFERLHGGLILILGHDIDDSGRMNLSVSDLTLDSANVESLWLGTGEGRTIKVTGAVTATGDKPVDLRLGLAAIVYDDDISQRIGGAFIPESIEITGSLGTAAKALGNVGLIARQDILLGSSAYVDAARSSSFDEAQARSFAPATPNQLFVSAGSLQLAAAGRILQQNTAVGGLGGGLRIGAPTSERPLIFAPNVLGFFRDNQVAATSATASRDYSAGPTRVALFGGFTGTGESAGEPNPFNAKSDYFLGSPISDKSEYRFNGCAFSATGCGKSAVPVVPTAMVLSTATAANGAAAVVGATPLDPGSGNDAVLQLSATTTDMLRDEEERKVGVGLPITGSGNGDLWIPLEAVR